MNVALSLPVLIGLIAVALAFDFLNGLHDAANSIATIVSTRVLRPQYAVAWAAFFNFIAFLFFGLHVANTLGTGIIDAAAIDARVVFGALMGAILWNLITWGLGIPSSSSHAVRISELTAQLSALEGRADELHDVGLKALYQATKQGNAMGYIVGNEVYDHLEKVVDRFDDVANVMHGIVIEHV